MSTEPTPVDQPLRGLRVIELGGLVSAPYCARTLGLLGADVLKIETPAGDSARRYGPFRGDVPDPEGSGLFIYLNVGKRGVTLDLEHPGAPAVLQGLAAHADVLVENIGQRRLGELGIAFDDLLPANPDLVVASVTPFGLTGPRSGDAATHLSIFHAGGEGFTLPGGTGWRLFPDREPVQSAPLSAHYDAGSAAAVAVLVAMLARTLGTVAGGGELLDVSEQEAQLGINRVEMQRYPQRGFIETRATRDMPIGDIFQARNGFVAVEPLESKMWTGLCNAMGRPDLATDERFADKLTLYANGSDANTYIADWTIAFDKNDVYHTAQQNGCAAGPVRSPRDLYESEQLRARGFLSTVDGLDLEVPHAPHRLHDAEPAGPTPQRTVPRPPRLGEHNAEIYGDLLGWNADDCAWHQRGGLI